MGVERLALTDNVLVVMGSTMIMTWRLTEEGTVYGISAERTWANYYNSVRTASLPQEALGDLKLFVEGQTGMVGYCGGIVCHIYDTRTGEVHKPSQAPLHPESYFRPPIPETLNYFQDSCLYDNPTGNSLDRPTTSFEGGWVRGSEEERQLWLPVEWRAKAGEITEWLPDVAAMWFLSPQGEPVIIKLKRTLLSHSP